MSIDLTQLTYNKWYAAARRWQDANHGTIEIRDIPSKRIKQHDRIGNVVGIVEYDCARQAIVFKREVQPKRGGVRRLSESNRYGAQPFGSMTLQLVVPDYSEPSYLEFVIKRQHCTQYAAIPRDRAPVDGTDFIDFLRSNLPGYDTEFYLTLDDVCQDFFDAWINAVWPVPLMEEMHEIYDLNE